MRTIGSAVVVASSPRLGTLVVPANADGETSRHTTYTIRMTMLSFRVDEAEAAAAQRWASRLGVDRSELLRDALRRHLQRLASEDDVQAWSDQPLDEGELSLAAVADWGPAEDWSDWADAAR